MGQEGGEEWTAAVDMLTDDSQAQRAERCCEQRKPVGFRDGTPCRVYCSGRVLLGNATNQVEIDALHATQDLAADLAGMEIGVLVTDQTGNQQAWLDRRPGAPACALATLTATSGAQVSNMPPQVQARLAEVGPRWGKDIPGNINKTLEVYAPIRRDAPKVGIKVARDLAYGADARHKLDVYQPEDRTGMPVVVFIHGGAYVRGERDISPEVYGNVAAYFARQGMLGVNATYRLAPATQWPGAAEDVGAMLRWLRANAACFGGDASRITLIGHSAGATHVATYAYQKALQPAEGAGIAAWC